MLYIESVQTAGRVVPLETEKGNREEMTGLATCRYLPKLAWSEL